MKNPFFLRNLLFWAVGDSSTGALFSPSARGIRKYYPWLLVIAAGMAVVLVWGEWQKNWFLAQASLITILLLLAFAVWCWWQARIRPSDLSVKAAVYHQAVEKLLWCVAIGLVAMISIASQWEHWKYGIVCRAIGYGILIAGATFISGVLLGYLFGLRPTDSARSAGQPATAPPQTNLVEIADWLTKIILGAGLVQLTRLPTPIWKFASTMADGVVAGTHEPPNPPMAIAIMGFFSTCGLLYGYIWTRYEEAVTDDASADALALALVDRWLNGRVPPDEQTRLDMIEAVKHASSAAKMRIFLQAEQYRRPSTEDVNERSLPVFQALVDGDLQAVFHRNRGQCALALMGRMKDPKSLDDDWRSALDLLNDAIRIRDSSAEPGWHEYEFARAVCQITVDPNFRKDLPSDAQTIQSVQADLDKAKDVPEATKNRIDKNGIVNKWEGLIASKAA